MQRAYFRIRQNGQKLPINYLKIAKVAGKHQNFHKMAKTTYFGHANEYIPGADPMPVRCNGLTSVSVKMGERTGSVSSGLPGIIPLCLKCWPPRIGEALPKTARISAICRPKM